MIDEILKKILDSNEKYEGLTSEQAKEAQNIYGLNVRPVGKRRTWINSLWDIVSEPMILLLLVSSVIYFLIGDRVEAIILLVSIIPILIIEFTSLITVCNCSTIARSSSLPVFKRVVARSHTANKFSA